MNLLPDAFPPLEGRSLGSIKHKEREKGQCEHPGETEEKCSKPWFSPWEGEFAHPVA